MDSRDPDLSSLQFPHLALYLLAVFFALPVGAQESSTPAPTADPFANVTPRSYITADEIVGRIKSAGTAVKNGAQAPTDVLLKSGPTMAVMSYRNKPADHAEVHETEDELFVVLEGAGDLTMGGSLIDPMRNGTTLSSPKIIGGWSTRWQKAT